MKKVFLFVTLLVSFSFLKAQTKQIPIPDFVDQVMYYDTVNNTISKLENAKPEYKSRGVALYYGGTKALISLDGKSSPVRFNHYQPQVFILKLKDPNVDPLTYINFSICESSKKSRSAEYMKATVLSSTVKTNKGRNILNVQKVSNDVCIITLTEKLNPGEYTFTYELGMVPTQCFAFGVD